MDIRNSKLKIIKKVRSVPKIIRLFVEIKSIIKIITIEEIIINLC